MWQGSLGGSRLEGIVLNNLFLILSTVLFTKSLLNVEETDDVVQKYDDIYSLHNNVDLLKELDDDVVEETKKTMIL